MKTAILENFLSKDELSNCLEIFNTLHQDPNKLTRNKSVFEINSNQILNYGLLNQLNSKISSLLKERTEMDFYFFQLWVGKNTKNNFNKNELPYITHFDRSRRLKGMIYLSDVTKENGPIHLCENNYDWIEDIRKSLPSNWMDSKINSSSLIGKIKPPIPIIKESKTLILFDTNTPHHAGEVLDGKERKYLRFDYIIKDKNNFI
jgi:hypothetical protein